MSEKNFPGPIQIPLATAEVWEKRYEDDTTIETRENKVKSFLIPRESLENVLALNTDAVRAYIGINDQQEKTLLFVGAQYDKETGKYVDVYGHSSSQQNRAESADDIVFDGTRPSPPY
ncbi:hypothetical protein DBB36_18935 [Flavobacterium sp. WLB]|uniref:Uncharacterized protein n=1 Tax=Flavobacterium panici TaxID=2654843 RepID=A0A9N8J415_9FLAO|nr:MULTISPECIES: hypothetical protein [Flavobacterium]KOP35879.1 hypothetical protein AKO67_22770 [Flavobacterium sp. VMW]OWU88929.1 hypothetical protein APR43_20070 [Flavobacterium sp. NLM]PUU68409.1 hypothetical protein DBB36_18935 [Flavobacterium sp. WLB]UUF14543.1 hypothetical protein NLJ00_00200 [Flavobacterium panici]CAC9975819.1 hypothetical protein FLAPXU55_03536 [Flavobacterium panici]